MTAEQYLEARVEFLRVEREFRRLIGIIVKRPSNYCDTHEEDWDCIEPEAELWDGAREYNVDEVPFIMDIKKKQVVSIGERVSVQQKVLKHLKKYRQGTLVVISNCNKVEMMTIIFPKAGMRVEQQMNQLFGDSTGKVAVACTKSGSMTAPAWRQLLARFANVTKPVRQARDLQGKEWRKAIVLNMDNYGVHLNNPLAARYAREYGIFLRCLIKNASHYQQPVDQNLGKTIKEWLLTELKDKYRHLLAMPRLTRRYTIALPDWRKMVLRLCIDAIRKV